MATHRIRWGSVHRASAEGSNWRSGAHWSVSCKCVSGGRWVCAGSQEMTFKVEVKTGAPLKKLKQICPSTFPLYNIQARSHPRVWNCWASLVVHIFLTQADTVNQPSHYVLLLEWFLISKKVAVSTEKPLTLPLSFPFGSISCHCHVFIKETDVCLFLPTQFHLDLELTTCFTDVHFSVPGSYPQWVACPSFMAVTVPVFFTTETVWRGIDQAVCKCHSVWVCVMFLFMTTLGLWVLGKETTGVKCLSQPTLSRGHDNDIQVTSLGMLILMGGVDWGGVCHLLRL